MMGCVSLGHARAEVDELPGRADPAVRIATARLRSGMRRLKRHRIASSGKLEKPFYASISNGSPMAGAFYYRVP